jgi:uncharacterized protein YegL
LVPRSGKTNFLKTKQSSVPSSVKQPKFLAKFVPQSRQTDGLSVRQNLFELNGDSYARTTITNRSNEISPLNAIFVVDISGSMSGSTGTNDKEMSKFSQLDLVKHQLQTVLTPLDENSHVGIVLFNSRYHVLQPLAPMEITTKTNLINSINSLSPNGGTSMSGALEVSINMFNNMKHLENPKIVVLSDGMADDTNTILNIAKSTDSKHIQLSTFGYGYEIDYKLLAGLAGQLNGQFSRVPDHSMGLTNWVNWLTHSLWDYKPVLSDKINFRLVSNVPYSFITKYNDRPSKFVTTTKTILENDFEQVDSDNEKFMSFNLMMRQHIFTSLQDTLVNGQYHKLDTVLNQMYEYISKSPQLMSNKHARDIAENIMSGNPHSGQLLKALDNKYLHKWGEAYLYSMASGLSLQRCLTFKDPIFQIYGESPEFIGLRTELEEIMTKVPIPQPSNSSTPYQGNFMNSTYQPSNPCVDGDMYVKLRDGIRTQLKFLKKGDILENGSIIECIVETKLSTLTQMVNINDVLITPYHPVQNSNGKWVFPCELGKINEYPIKSVFSFVLDKGHNMRVYSSESTEKYINTITWGHKIKGDKVLEHDFFGNKILNELKKQKGWTNGYIQIKHYEPDFVHDNDGNKTISSFGKTKFA